MIDTNTSRQCNTGRHKHHQIIHFVGGVKRLIQNVMYVWENEMVHIADELGVGMSIYQRNLDHPIWSIAYQVICKNMTGTHKILTALYPYLCGNKKAVAEMTMRFVESREFGKTRKPYSEKDNKLYADCKQINCKGKDKIYLSSETLRSALANITKIIGSEDKVQTSMKVGETIPQEL